MSNFFSLTQHLIAVLERPKWLVLPCPWVLPGPNGQRGFTLKGTLRDEVGSIPGLRFEMRCHVEGFDLPSSLVLLAEFKDKSNAMARIDINGSPHTNRPAICGDWQHLDAGKTHFHDTKLHAGVAIEELFLEGHDLPIARPITDLPDDFTAAMEKCGALLHILNLNEVEEPPWHPKRLL